MSGVTIAATSPWHPNIFARPLDEVVRNFGAWAFLHVLVFVAVVLALLGAAGLVAAHNGRLGRLGQVGLLVTLVGVVMTAAFASIEAITFPVLAKARKQLALDHRPTSNDSITSSRRRRASIGKVVAEHRAQVGEILGVGR
jgi:hypothetical protein